MSSPIKGQGLGSDHMDKSVSKEQPNDEGYERHNDPALAYIGPLAVSCNMILIIIHNTLR
jgi:hypothetical protein